MAFIWRRDEAGDPTVAWSIPSQILLRKDRKLQPYIPAWVNAMIGNQSRHLQYGIVIEFLKRFERIKTLSASSEEGCNANSYRDVQRINS